jgi:hypothetical protein
LLSQLELKLVAWLGQFATCHRCFYLALPNNKWSEILGSLIVKAGRGLPDKPVFVQNRNKRRDWLVVMPTFLFCINYLVVFSQNIGISLL